MNINTIEIDGKEYTLCLTRKAIKLAEKSGLTLDGFEKRPINTIDLLWRASLLKNHPEINEDKAEDLYEKFEEQHPEKVSEVIKALIEQYGDFFKALNNIQ